MTAITAVLGVVGSDQIKRVDMGMLRDLDRGKIVEAVREGFADALFRVWLGDEPVDSDLKDRMLGR